MDNIVRELNAIDQQLEQAVARMGNLGSRVYTTSMPIL